MSLSVMFGLFVFLMLRAPSAQIHTEWWGIFDLQPPEVWVLFDNFIIFFFFLQRHCDVGPDKMHTPGCVENIRPVPQNVFLAVVDPDGIEVYGINSLGAFIYH